VIIISLRRFKTYKSDAAPFFFFIDIYPPDRSTIEHSHLSELINSIKSNPIMPLPMRVDRVYNGEKSILLRPRKLISSQITEELTAYINPLAFIQLGIEKLLYFTEIHGREKFSESLSPERAKRWWNSTRFLYGNLLKLEEDFSYFLKTYLETLVKAKVINTDVISAAKDYCQSISEICKIRIDENSILVESKNIKSNGKLYIKKDVVMRKKFKKFTQTQVHPELIDIEVFDLSQTASDSSDNNKADLLTSLKPKIMKYIPFLFYDDLYECMLDNLSKLEEKKANLLDPTFLIENKVIILEHTKVLNKTDLKSYSWWRNYNDIDLDSILESIKTTLEEFLLKLYDEFHPKEDKWKTRLDS
jgi:hypothetical protein